MMKVNLTLMQRKIRRLHSQHVIHESFRFGILLALAGGFLDSYTFIGRGGVFANAQTGNIVLLAVYAAKGKWMKALSNLPAIVAFVIGVIVVESIKNNSSRVFKLDWPRVVLIFEIIVLFIIGFIPSTIPNLIVNVTVSFVASIQVCSFSKIADSPYSSTMSTGNLRSAAREAYIAFTQKDHEAAIRTIRLFTIVFSFLLGSVLGGILTLNIGVKAIWGAAVIIIGALVLYNINNS